MGACYSKSASEQGNTPKNKQPIKNRKQKNGLAVTVEYSQPSEERYSVIIKEDEEEINKPSSGQVENDISSPDSHNHQNKDHTICQTEKGENGITKATSCGDVKKDDTIQNRTSDVVVDTDCTISNEEENLKVVKSSKGCDGRQITSDDTLSSSSLPHSACSPNSPTASTEGETMHEVSRRSVINEARCACCRLSYQDTLTRTNDSPPVTPLDVDTSNMMDISEPRTSITNLRGFDSMNSLNLASAFQSLQDVKTMEIDGKEVVVIEKDTYTQIMDEIAMLKLNLSQLTEIIREQDTSLSLDLSRSRCHCEEENK